MQVLCQMPHQIVSSTSTGTCGKTIYATEKVREAIRDHEMEIASTVSPKHKAKVVVLGESGVGKTSIIYRHRFGSHFGTVNSTIGASFVSCDLKTETNGSIRLQVWDTAGQERFRCMVPMYMRNADAALIVYDVTNRDSFENVSKWIKDLERSCGTDDTLIYLIGNKVDLKDNREISEEEGKAKAVKLNAQFFEISSGKPELFSQLLAELADSVLTARKNRKNSIETESEKKHIFLDYEKINKSDIAEIKLVKSKCCSLL